MNCATIFPAGSSRGSSSRSVFLFRQHLVRIITLLITNPTQKGLNTSHHARGSPSILEATKQAKTM